MDSDDTQDWPAAPPAAETQSNASDTSDAAPVDTLQDEGGGPTGAAPTHDEPAAHGDHAHADDLVGDWAEPDVDLSGLIPTDDGDPDDDEEPVRETVEQDPTGQAVVTDRRPADRPGDDGARMDGR